MAKKNKNVSKKINNGTLIITCDNYFQSADGKSKKIRMASVIDSNRNDELALVKYTTSKKHGKSFKNSQGFCKHGDMVYTEDIEGKPIKVDGNRFKLGSKKRKIEKNMANEIKRRNIKQSKFKDINLRRLKIMKGRKKGTN